MVRKIVGRFVARLPPSVQRDDLVGAGMYGLVDALRRKPGRRGPGFQRYVFIRVRGAIVDELRTHDWLSRSARTRVAGQRENGPACLSAVVPFDDLSKDVRNSFADPRALSPLAAVEREHQRQALAAAVGLLVERDRLILNLFYFQGVQLKEIAAQLGVSKPRVSQLHSRAIARLRSSLSPSVAP